MSISSGIITNKGGKTCHAAIIARELGVNAIVGCENATDILNNVSEITMNCADGDIGKVYNGIKEYETKNIQVDTSVKLPINIMMNIDPLKVVLNILYYQIKA